MKNQPITHEKLKSLLEQQKDIQLIDVREPYEHTRHNIGGDLIPLNTIANNTDKIAKDKMVIIYCRSGARSGMVIELLEQKFGFDNLYNLAGGIG